MKIFKELSIIFIFYLMGEGISLLLPFDFPGSVIGMFILLAALGFKWLRLEDIRSVSDFLLKYMALFFIPAGVSVMNSFSIVQSHLIAISATLILSTLVMLVIIALIVDFLVKRVKDA